MITFRVTIAVAATLQYAAETGELFVQAADRAEAARKARQWIMDKLWHRPPDDIDISVRVHEGVPFID